MNPYTNISNELKAFFGSNSIIKILLPIDMALLFGGLAITVLNDLFGIGFGSIITSLAYWAFIFGLLLTYANMHEQFLYIGLLGYGAYNALLFLKILIFTSHAFSWSCLFNTIIFGYLGYLVFKKTAVHQ